MLRPNRCRSSFQAEMQCMQKSWPQLPARWVVCAWGARVGGHNMDNERAHTFVSTNTHTGRDVRFITATTTHAAGANRTQKVERAPLAQKPHSARQLKPAAQEALLGGLYTPGGCRGGVVAWAHQTVAATLCMASELSCCTSSPCPRSTHA